MLSIRHCLKGVAIVVISSLAFIRLCTRGALIRRRFVSANLYLIFVRSQKSVVHIYWMYNNQAEVLDAAKGFKLLTSFYATMLKRVLRWQKSLCRKHLRKTLQFYHLLMMSLTVVHTKAVCMAIAYIAKNALYTVIAITAHEEGKRLTIIVVVITELKDQTLSRANKFLTLLKSGLQVIQKTISFRCRIMYSQAKNVHLTKVL